jgi:hypothetical protein
VGKKQKKEGDGLGEEEDEWEKGKKIEVMRAALFRRSCGIRLKEKSPFP